MFQSSVDQAWLFYEQLTPLYYYKVVQRQVVEAYTRYRNIVERYSEKTGRKVQAVTMEYLREHPEVAEQNVALLKNAMELWRTASRASSAVAPMLYHYSWHCFNSFFVYTFFRWEPPHSSSHGITIDFRDLVDDNIEDVKVKISKRKDGLFQRLIDTWTLLGASLAFSPFLPVCQQREVNFEPDEHYLVSSSSRISLSQLLAFTSVDFEKALGKDKVRRARIPRTRVGIIDPTDTIKNYLLVFASSNLARYRPIVWNSVLVGKTQEQSNLATQWKIALLGFRDFLNLVSNLLTAITEERFKIECWV